MYPIVALTTFRVVYDEAHSALPNAPVVPYRESRLRNATTAARTSAASTLRRVADRLEPVGSVQTDCA